MPRGVSAVATGSPTVRQRELGMRLREFRHVCGLTVEEVAARLMCSAPKVSRVETGARRPSLRDVRDLCTIYGVDPAIANELMGLAREALQPGWWAQYEDLEVTSLIGLEQEATSITCFRMYAVPALLQTEDYASAVIKGVSPKIDPGTVYQRVEARLRRQELLRRDRPPKYRVLLDEAVLHRQVGGTAVIRVQLDKILNLVSEDRVIVQIIPFSVGAYAARDSNFDYLEFGESSLPGMVFVEGLVRDFYLERPAELGRFREVVEYLRDVALTPRDSVKTIKETYEKFTGALR